MQQDSQLNAVESTCRPGLSADMLQMPDGGIWGNPSGFVEGALQVQSVLAPCEHREKRQLQVYFLRLQGLSRVWLSKCCTDCEFFQPHCVLCLCLHPDCFPSSSCSLDVWTNNQFPRRKTGTESWPFFKGIFKNECST